jgi:uncharacterized protein (TIGR03905 family)
MKYTYKTQGTCSTEIHFEINENIISSILFKKGCNGNLQAISRLVNGMTVNEITEKCKGIICVEKDVNKGTSCADQLALAVEKAYGESLKNHTG